MSTYDFRKGPAQVMISHPKLYGSVNLSTSSSGCWKSPLSCRARSSDNGCLGGLPTKDLGRRWGGLGGSRWVKRGEGDGKALCWEHLPRS